MDYNDRYGTPTSPGAAFDHIMSKIRSRAKAFGICSVAPKLHWYIFEEIKEKPGKKH